jgi:hypothetical protein
MVMSHTTASALELQRKRDERTKALIAEAMDELDIDNLDDPHLPHILDDREQDLRYWLKLVEYLRTVTLSPRGKRFRRAA